MSEQSKKPSNGTVDQIIEHMTADLQNSDGQYIQLGFTPPPTPNDSINWTEYSQGQLSNPFIQHYGRNADTMPYHMDATGSYLNQNVTFNNYMTQNQIFMPEIQNNGYDSKYVLYPNQHAQYVLPSQEVPMCRYMSVYPEDREYALFANQEMQSMHQGMGQSAEMYVPDMMLPNQELGLKSKLVLQPGMQPAANRTHIIENLVGNWAPNNTGTYSPFGNVPTQTAPNLFDVKPEPAAGGAPAADGPASDPDRDYNLKTIKSSGTVKKAKQVAEVKPMRPSYSDVLTKSAPQTAQKVEKVDSANAKLKNQTNKKSKNPPPADKYPKNAVFGRQTSSNTDNKENLAASAPKPAEKSQEAKPNLSRKWVSLDDVHDSEQSSGEMFKDVESSKTRKNQKKVETPPAAAKSDVAAAAANNNINNNNNKTAKKTFKDANTNLGCQWTESEEIIENTKSDEKNVNKNPSKKVAGKENRSNSIRQGRLYERSAEKPPGSTKKGQRVRKRESNSTFAVFNRTVQLYVSRWCKLILCALMWLYNLVSDIFSMSLHLGRDLGTIFWDSVIVYTKSFFQNIAGLLKRVKVFTKIGSYIDKNFGGYSWAFWNHGKKEKTAGKQENKTWLNSGLEHNITMPLTGEEAMKRLLACKGKDPYSILGVRPDCTDDDIKRYYKRQAFLVHPDKNPQPGAEEAFKILVHAFDIIGEPERRQSYDRKVAESHQVEQAWSELNDLLSQLHQKMEYAANTIRCTNCTKRHRRLNVDRPCYAARMCSQCKIHHSAKEGDIWAEAKYFGFLWHYYACMDGAVYDITEWAGCQRKNLKHLRPNSHNVQYRIVLGKQGQGGTSGASRRSFKGAVNNSEREADIESFLNNLYNQSDMNSSANTSAHSDVNGRADNVKSRKKNKRKK